MLERIQHTASSYWAFYGQFVREQWQNMTPAKYGILLLSIGVIGFLLLKSANKR